MAPLQQRASEFPFLHLFLLSRPLKDWMMATGIGEGDCLSLKFTWESLLAILSQSCPGIVLPAIWVSLSPVKLTCRIIHLRELGGFVPFP
jgi:hypothetical protein